MRPIALISCLDMAGGETTKTCAGIHCHAITNVYAPSLDASSRGTIATPNDSGNFVVLLKG